jgi:HNH endonuclease
MNIKHRVFVSNETAVIEVFNRNYKLYFYVLIDKEDIPRLIGKVNKLSVGVNSSTNYCYFHRDGKLYSLHRFLMDTPDGLVVDHINHNGLDNRKSNLRNCTYKVNRWNTIKGNRNPLYGTFDRFWKLNEVNHESTIK